MHGVEQRLVNKINEFVEETSTPREAVPCMLRMVAERFQMVIIAENHNKREEIHNILGEM